MYPMRVTVSSASPSQAIPLNFNTSPFNVSIGVNLSAGASLTYSVQYTFDDVFAPNFNPSTANWFTHGTLTGKTSSSDGNIAFPVTAVRLNVTPYVSGTAQIVVIQAGIT